MNQKKLLNENTLYECDEFSILKEKTNKILSKDIVENAYLKSGIYDNVSDFIYEHKI